MSSHSVNLAIRFLLEITTLIATGMWGWRQGENGWQYVFAICIPLLLAALWGIFAVKGDPSRSGKTVVETPGIIRLILELGFFSFGCWVIHNLGWDYISLIFGLIVIAHYVVSYDRVRWLLSELLD